MAAHIKEMHGHVDLVKGVVGTREGGDEESRGRGTRWVLLFISYGNMNGTPC